MYENPLTDTQEPSTFQVRVFSNYGVVGIILLFLLLIKSENILLNSSKNNYYPIFLFLVFMMSIQYFMFLILMYFFALKANQANQHNNIKNKMEGLKV